MIQGCVGPYIVAKGDEHFTQFHPVFGFGSVKLIEFEEFRTCFLLSITVYGGPSCLEEMTTLEIDKGFHFRGSIWEGNGCQPHFPFSFQSDRIGYPYLVAIRSVVWVLLSITVTR